MRRRGLGRECETRTLIVFRGHALNVTYTLRAHSTAIHGERTHH